jgi:phosphatidylserine decarboxylase
MKIHQEGILFILISSILAALGFVINFKFCLIMSVIALGITYFFRDPDRVMPDGENIILSPCDGKVIDISPDQYQGENYMRVSVFLNINDVHVNRIPLSGKITQKIHKLGTFAHAASQQALLNNENLTLKIEGAITIFVRQVAGFVARRIVCYPKNGDDVKIGERYGIIKFGSRMDLFLPNTVSMNIKKGQIMIGGETVIAFFKA